MLLETSYVSADMPLRSNIYLFLRKRLANSSVVANNVFLRRRTKLWQLISAIAASYHPWADTNLGQGVIFNFTE